MDTQIKQRVIASMLSADRPALANAVSRMATAGKYEPLDTRELKDFQSEIGELIPEYKEALKRALYTYHKMGGDKPSKQDKYKLTNKDVDWIYEDLRFVPPAQVKKLFASTRITAGAKLSSSLKSKINRDLIKAGLDGNGRFRKVGEAISTAHGVFQKHGIEEDDVFSADRFRGESGHTTFNMAFSNKEDPFSPEPISNSMLVIQWHLFAENGQYEVLMYMS